MASVFAISGLGGFQWHAPFVFPGQGHLLPSLDDLSFDERLDLCRVAESKFNELAKASGSSAIWRQIQTAVMGDGCLLPNGKTRRACGTTNLQLKEWLDIAVACALSSIEEDDG